QLDQHGALERAFQPAHLPPSLAGREEGTEILRISSKSHPRSEAMRGSKRSVDMPKLRGLILASTSSADDDLAHRLQGRSRYAMPLANRVLVRYAAEALVASGVRALAVAVSRSTAQDVRELLGDGRRFGAHFQYLEVSEQA